MNANAWFCFYLTIIRNYTRSVFDFVYLQTWSLYQLSSNVAAILWEMPPHRIAILLAYEPPEDCPQGLRRRYANCPFLWGPSSSHAMEMGTALLCQMSPNLNSSRRAEITAGGNTKKLRHHRAVWTSLVALGGSGCIWFSSVAPAGSF